MSNGPIEYLVIAFPDGNVSDDVAPALADLVDRKVIRILDLVFVRKDPLGEILVFEFDEIADMEGFAAIDAEVGGLIGDADIRFVGEELDLGSAAVLLLLEDLWALPLAGALDASGAVLLEGARVPQDLAAAALAGLATL